MRPCATHTATRPTPKTTMTKQKSITKKQRIQIQESLNTIAAINNHLQRIARELITERDSEFFDPDKGLAVSEDSHELIDAMFAIAKSISLREIRG